MERVKIGHRPARDGEPATIRLSLRVTPREHAEIERAALENHMPIATMLRDALNEFVADASERGVFLRSCG